MQTLYIHPKNPQPRLINQTYECLKSHQAIILPSDFGYVVAVALSAKNLQETLQKSNNTEWVLMCQDLTQLSHYATISNEAFQTIKNHVPVSIFTLPATKATPKTLIHPKHKTISTHLTTEPIHLSLIEALAEPFVIGISHESITEPHIAETCLGHEAQLLIDVGILEEHPITTVKFD